MLHSGDISSKVFENFTTYEHKKGSIFSVFDLICDCLQSQIRSLKNKTKQVLWALTGESMSSRRSTEQRSHCSKVSARCMIFLTIFSRSVCSSKRSLTTSSRACGLTKDTNDFHSPGKPFFGYTTSAEQTLHNLLLSKFVN